MKYRAEIDGLRCLAVVPVILFHAGFELFSGGFVGVDVFFVISGYLITTIIIKDIEKNRFSFFNFYERRARRILPALFFVMFFCMPFAWMWMLPGQLKDFAQSLVAISVFGSNILFWIESGYFSANAEEKPLLHTWSLAVEEQFYLIFPVCLVLFWRFGRNLAFWIIALTAALSFLLSEWSWRNMPDANFYLAPTRAWELLAGSIVAIYSANRGLRNNNFLAGTGLAMIIFSVYFYDETIPFPSLYTLAPVLGTVLLILYANDEAIVAKWLSTSIFVRIGLISYSAYLWHQPLFAFARIRMVSDPKPQLMLILTFFTFIIAYFTWRYVERPSREKTQKRLIFFSIAFGFISFILIGISGHQNNGFPSRFKPTVSGYENHMTYLRRVDERYVRCEPEAIAVTRAKSEGIVHCHQSKEGIADWIILGDSHAAHLFPGLAKSTDKNVVYYTAQQPYMHKEDFVLVYQYLSELSPKIIFVTMRYVTRIENKNEFFKYFDLLSRYLTDLGHVVILVGDVPMFNTHAERCLYGSNKQIEKYCSISIEEWLIQKSQYERYLLKISSDVPNVFYLDIGGLFCDKFLCSMTDDSKNILFRDHDHLNLLGSERVGPLLASFAEGLVVESNLTP